MTKDTWPLWTALILIIFALWSRSLAYQSSADYSKQFWQIMGANR